MTTVCLNMIVKNESKIITRLFDTVLGIIDSYCICDTGSTDNTINIIKKYFDDKNITGKIIQEPFSSFSHNRNHALKECLGMSDYILLLDADMCLNIKSFDKNTLKLDYYYILQGSDSFYYKNVRIIKNDENFKYVGYTHEYISFISKKQCYETINKDVLFINDLGDGGSKEDKFKRDIILLEKSIIEKKDESRSYFYLGNSYKDIGDHENAIKNYKIVLELNGWVQEKYMACYHIGILCNELNDNDNTIKYFLKTVEYDDERMEGIIALVEYFYYKKIYMIVNLLYNKFKNYKKDINDKLFLYTDKYKYLLEYYNSISAFYVKDYDSGYICCKMCIENNIYKEQSLKNIKFYKEIQK